MDEEARRRCLEPFFTTKGERGTGLGLAMVYGMIQRYSAEIEIEKLPRQRPFDAVSRVYAAARGRDAFARRAGPHALPARADDDHPIIIKAMKDALAGDGHVTVAAGGGQAGLEAFGDALRTNHPFELVVTEISPHVDGVLGKPPRLGELRAVIRDLLG